ncbi:beta-amyrin 28-monooxygenase-like [Cornus florida]|uniref:beta-amyrin 28-monooxygenase-like n=1 Tax=Cornus florida TaxID=4283 RepID=UPI00289DD88E|nr:beta-amyrin 28-monooxygenase-like [Cornus florida]
MELSYSSPVNITTGSIMELSYSSPLNITIFTLVLVVFLYNFIHHLTSPRKTKLPPGSFGWPIIGESYEFLYGNSQKFIGDRMKKYSPKVFKTKLHGEPTVVLCGPAGHKFITVNEEKLFRTWRPYSLQKLFRAPFLPDTKVVIPRETLVHVTKAPGFIKTDALIEYAGKMDSMIQQQFKLHWRGKPEVKAYELLHRMAANLSSRFFLGLEENDPRMEKFAMLSFGMTQGLNCIPINFPGTRFYRAKKVAETMRKEVLQIIKEKKAAMCSGVQTNDILSHMMLSGNSETGRFKTETEIATMSSAVVVSGFTTPSTGLSIIMKYIGERPEIYNKIREEQMEISSSKKPGELLNWEDIQKMKYTWHTALEVMRLRPPFQGAFREALSDFTYEGYTIPKGWKVYWTVTTTNNNPECFPEPEKFSPTRFESLPPYTFVPFGGGIRMCPGKEYTRLVMLTFLHNVVKYFKWEVLAPNEDMIGTVLPVPKNGFPIHLHPLST